MQNELIIKAVTLYKRAIDMSDEFIKQAYAFHGSYGKLIPCEMCRKPFCCNQFVTVYTFEALAIGYLLGAFKKDAMGKFADEIFRATKQDKMLWDSKDGPYYLLASKTDEKTFKNAFHKFQIEWMNKNNKCSFLDDNNKCAIYEYRPLACRDYMVLCDPSECNPENTELIPMVNADKLILEYFSMDAAFMGEIMNIDDELTISLPLPFGTGLNLATRVLSTDESNLDKVGFMEIRTNKSVFTPPN